MYAYCFLGFRFARICLLLFGFLMYWRHQTATWLVLLNELQDSVHEREAAAAEIQSLFQLMDEFKVQPIFICYPVCLSFDILKILLHIRRCAGLCSARAYCSAPRSAQGDRLAG